MYLAVSSLEVKCPRCGYTWGYSGSSPWVTCPRCRKRFKIVKGNDGKGSSIVTDREFMAEETSGVTKSNDRHLSLPIVTHSIVTDANSSKGNDREFVKGNDGRLSLLNERLRSEVTIGNDRSRLSDLLRMIVREVKRLRRELEQVREDLRIVAYFAGIPPRLLEGVRVEILPKSVPDEAIERCVEKVGGKILAKTDAGLDIDVPDDKAEEFSECLRNTTETS